MIEQQLITRGIQNHLVLEAMLKVKRHLFVPSQYLNKAYDDTPLPIGQGQTISQPYMVAFMTEVLQLSNRSRVLEIGTGSGYQTAILAEICKEVFTIEVLESLGYQARALLSALKYKNIHFKIGDGYTGWPEFAPFDAILVTCAPTHIPETFKEQIDDQGQIIVPVGDQSRQELLLIKKKQHKIMEKSIFPVKFVPMTNAKGSTY